MMAHQQNRIYYCYINADLPLTLLMILMALDTKSTEQR